MTKPQTAQQFRAAMELANSHISHIAPIFSAFFTEDKQDYAQLMMSCFGDHL